MESLPHERWLIAGLCGSVGSRAADVRVPTLLVVADADPFSRTSLECVRAGLVNAEVQVHHVAGGTIPLMEQCAPEIADAVHALLASLTNRC